jgi:hypothetical protein
MRELKNQMSLSSLNVEEEENRLIRVWLLSSLKVKKKTHYRLAARFRLSGQTWTVNRRYSEFLSLKNQLIRYFSNAPNPCPACENYLHAIKLFEFPRKHLFASNSPLVVNYRTRALRAFLNLLASWTFSNAPKCPTCAGFAFDAVKNFIIKGGEPYKESNMDEITSSFSVEMFVSHNIEKSGSSSSGSRIKCSIPASGSETLRAKAGNATNKNQRPSIVIEDPYENFNDYLPGQPDDKIDNLGNVRDHAVVIAKRANDSFISLTGSESGLVQQEYMPVFKFLRDENGNGKAVPVGAEPIRYGSQSMEQRYGSLTYFGPNEPIRKSASSFVSERSSFAGHVETPKKTVATPQGGEGTRSESHSLFGSFISDSTGNDPIRELVIFPPRSSLSGLMDEKIRSSVTGRRMEDRLPNEHKRHSETIRQPWEVAIKG